MLLVVKTVGKGDIPMILAGTAKYAEHSERIEMEVSPTLKTKILREIYKNAELCPETAYLQTGFVVPEGTTKVSVTELSFNVHPFITLNKFKKFTPKGEVFGQFIEMPSEYHQTFSVYGRLTGSFGIVLNQTDNTKLDLVLRSLWDTKSPQDIIRVCGTDHQGPVIIREFRQACLDLIQDNNKSASLFRGLVRKWGSDRTALYHEIVNDAVAQFYNSMFTKTLA